MNSVGKFKMFYVLFIMLCGTETIFLAKHKIAIKIHQLVSIQTNLIPCKNNNPLPGNDYVKDDSETKD